MTISETELRRRGVRLTPQRRMILDAISHGNGHVTAEEIHQQIVAVYPDMNLSTIYRNLERLCHLRLVAVTDLGGGHVRYEALGDAPHHHLICHSCGAMLELDDACVARLRACIAETHDFTAEIDHLAVWGVCARCRETDDSAKGGEHAHS